MKARPSYAFYVVMGLILLVILFFLTGCTENERARSFGGSQTIVLEPGQKLVMATWKETDLWFLTRPMSANDSAQTYVFKESSSFGMFEGTVTIREVKP